MSNILENRLDITMTPAQITAAKAGFASVETAIPFLTGLNVEERVAIPKINVSNKAFVEDAINALVNNSSLAPTYIDVVKIKNDLLLFSQLDELAQICRKILEKIEDTQMLAGSEAYISSLIAYRMFGTAAAAGLPGADSIYDQLKARFLDNGNSSAAPTT